MQNAFLRIVDSAFNEVVNGIDIPKLFDRLNSSQIKLATLGERLDTLLDNKESHFEEPSWSNEELSLIKAILCELLKELDSFEFSTRMGVSEDEVFAVLKSVKLKIDAQRRASSD
ncbi:MAG: hypothetical protein KBC38_00755 [Candidatus Pacebacteria bacterium]|nr:hypothetical protein [Candidatus Paceibacterota bacterium]MBP9840526.1 hypothetical protein [Candidatus Paceibacterota bacterium]